MKSYKFFVSGRVQGVYYRANVAKNANKANYSGYIKNLEDGRVEAGVSCAPEQLEVFKAILKKGSPLSKVTAMEEVESEERFIGSFEVRK